MRSAYGLHDLKRFCKNGRIEEALKTAKDLLSSGLEVSSGELRIIAQTCLQKGNLNCGKLLLDFIITYGIVLDPILGCQYICMFMNHKSLPEANQTFYCIRNPNKFAWSAIIYANATLGQGKRAIELYHHMQDKGVEPDGHTFVAVLKGCANIRDLSEGRQIEIDVKSSLCKCNEIVANALIDMYVKCGSLEDAHRVFNGSPKRDVISWNILILGYASHGHNDKAFFLFSEMNWKGIKPDPASFISILKACNGPKYLIDGNIMYTFILEESVESDLRVGNTLVHMYALCGSLEHACKVFDNLPKRAMVTWNVMISGYIEQNRPVEALFIFQLMHHMGLKPNAITFLCIIKVCNEIESIDLGRQIHAFIIETHAENNVTISNALIDMYNKRGDIQEAEHIFNRMPERVVVTWNALIPGFIQHGQAPKAFEYFNEMLQTMVHPDLATCVSILGACLPDVTDVIIGLEVHAFIVFSSFETEVIIGNSLIDMYTRYGNLKDAHKVFEKLRRRDTVSWNTLMTGYIQHFHTEKASALFFEMQLEGAEPDRTTFLCLLKSLADFLSIDQMNILFHLIVESGFENDQIIQSILVNLYVKCGNLKSAGSISCGLSNRDLVTWNALIAEHAYHGDRRVMHDLFKSMQNEDVKPDETTFTSLFATVGHAGSLVEGKFLFHTMRECYGIIPTLDHYNCLVDVLGRAGHIKEAEDVLQVMPSPPDIIGWTCLLEHSKTHDSIKVGKRCYNNFVTLDKEDASGYILMWKMSSRFWLDDGRHSTVNSLRHVETSTMSIKER